MVFVVSLAVGFFGGFFWLLGWLGFFGGEGVAFLFVIFFPQIRNSLLFISEHFLLQTFTFCLLGSKEKKGGGKHSHGSVSCS